MMIEVIKQRVPIAQAAKELGMGPQKIRERMYSGELKIGDVFKNKNKKPQKARYYIYRDKLDAHLGKMAAKEEAGSGAATPGEPARKINTQ